MQRSSLVLFGAMLFYWCACSDNGRVEGTSANAINSISSTQQENIIRGTDSLEVIFTDTVNAQPVISIYRTADTFSINNIVKIFDQQQITHSGCMPAVKAYCFKKNEVFKTIYFGLSEQCSVVFINVNGKNLYYHMTGNAESLLSDIRKKAIRK